MNLSVEEKLKLLVLKGMFDTEDLDGKVSGISLSDGPSGVRKPSTKDYKHTSRCYPSAVAVGNSWDRKVAKKVGEAIASDCIDQNVDIILAPGINIKRNPLNGRNFEYFSEDPFLTAELATEYIKGCQGRGVGTSLKHYCCYNREWDRLNQASEVDYRSLREIYLKAFELIFNKVTPTTVMSSYNTINGINCSENKYLLKGVLREKLGYNGVVLSDWEAVHNRVDALKASLDIMCPHSDGVYEGLLSAFKSGEITEEEIDESVNRILTLIKTIEDYRKIRKPLSEQERDEIAVESAEKSIVLLKNEGNILPLKGKKIAVIGELAEKPFYVGGGSAQTEIPCYPKPFHEELQSLMTDSEIKYSLGYVYGTCMTGKSVTPWTNGLKKVMGIAYDSDATVMIVGTGDIVDSESIDRTCLKLNPVTERNIIEVASETDNLVIVIQAGSAIDCSAWIDKVKGVVFAGYLGQGVNKALARIICGKVCPSGRLSETFPTAIETASTGIDYGNAYVDKFKEGVLVGYRWFLTNNIKTAFPFGFGLSYANIIYSDFTCKKWGDGRYNVKFKIKNDSDYTAGEVVQLYVKNVDMKVERPEKELRRFDKIYLNPHEERTVEFTTDKDCFEYFNTCYDSWQVDEGRYEILVCKNAEEIIFKEKVFLR